MGEILILRHTMNDVTLGGDFLKNERIKLLYDPQDILIQADKGRISQVISNLLSNAIKFTTEGTILISVGKDKISSSNTDNEAITVSSGQGIDLSILPRHKGTGLGLFISKGIIGSRW